MIINIFVILVYLYLIWRNLRDNYGEDKLIAFGWWSILLFILGSRITYGLVNWGTFDTAVQWWQIEKIPGLIYGGGIATVVGFSWWFSNKNGWKIWSFAEDILPFAYLILFVVELSQWWNSKDIKTLLFSLTMLFGYTLTLMFNGRYRSFSWYRSGKKGFDVGATGVIIFLVLIIEVVVFKESWMLLVLYSILSLLSLVQLVILGDIWHKK
jgi:prolipoprotein diacylglyceryltransferase